MDWGAWRVTGAVRPGVRMHALREQVRIVCRAGGGGAGRALRSADRRARRIGDGDGTEERGYQNVGAGTRARKAPADVAPRRGVR
ncbi:hypothetical protein GCM10010499_07720 [Streptomyces thermoviolaceus subsp. apingens]|nr:hypothetical protein GCM10010499_07720 [Streptomyces thermoviolaceus subsp. apingens]